MSNSPEGKRSPGKQHVGVPETETCTSATHVINVPSGGGVCCISGKETSSNDIARESISGPTTNRRCRESDCGADKSSDSLHTL